jgi:Fasciclin domain
MSKFTLTLCAALALAVLNAPQSTAQETCTIMGKETVLAPGETCPGDLYTVLSDLKTAHVVMKKDPVTGEEQEVTEIYTYDTFLELADKAGYGPYLRGETPPKVHGDGVQEGVMTIFAVSDQTIGETEKARLIALSNSQDPKDVEILRHFVGEHIVVVPETRASMWNEVGTRRTLAGPGYNAKFDTLFGMRRVNGVEIYDHDKMATNGVVHVMSAEIVTAE